MARVIRWRMRLHRWKRKFVRPTADGIELFSIAKVRPRSRSPDTRPAGSRSPARGRCLITRNHRRRAEPPPETGTADSASGLRNGPGAILAPRRGRFSQTRLLSQGWSIAQAPKRVGNMLD